MTIVGHESSTSGDNTRPATIDPRITIRDKLKEEIERYRGCYRGNYFIINSNKDSATINSNKIDRFFHRF